MMSFIYAECFNKATYAEHRGASYGSAELTNEVSRLRDVTEERVVHLSPALDQKSAEKPTVVLTRILV